MRVGSYLLYNYIPLPKDIHNKKSCVNVKNKDNKGFMWSVLAGLYEETIHPERDYHYKKYENDLNFKGNEFLVKPNDIPKFERQKDVSVNSYVLKKKQRGKDKVYHEVSPFHVTNHRKELCEVIVDSRL